ncbi:hypothetical protein HFD88_003721 [Aspergillus terreus]|nr:hypothetical protein HFD88_003721 [Aspergillus terreus]
MQEDWSKIDSLNRSQWTSGWPDVCWKRAHNGSQSFSVNTTLPGGARKRYGGPTGSVYEIAVLGRTAEIDLGTSGALVIEDPTQLIVVATQEVKCLLPDPALTKDEALTVIKALLAKENFQDLCLDEPASTEVAGYTNITTDVQTARTVILSSYTTWSHRTTEIEEVKEKPIRKSRRKGLAAGKSFSIPGNHIFCPRWFGHYW